METSPEGRTSWRRRWLGPLLVLGAAAAMAPLAQELPSERRVELRLAHPERIQRVTLTWLDGDELLKRTELTCSPASSSLYSSLSAKDGTYLLELTVFQGAEARSSRRQVVFDGEVDNVTIPVP